MNDDNTVFIGKKSIMSYVLAVVTQFNKANVDAVTIKARGRSISRAVDVEEIVRNRFMPDLEIKDVKLTTEEVESKEGFERQEGARIREGPIKVSAIEITLGKPSI